MAFFLLHSPLFLLPHHFRPYYPLPVPVEWLFSILFHLCLLIHPFLPPPCPLLFLPPSIPSFRTFLLPPGRAAADHSQGQNGSARGEPPWQSATLSTRATAAGLLGTCDLKAQLVPSSCIPIVLCCHGIHDIIVLSSAGRAGGQILPTGHRSTAAERQPLT